MTSNTVAIDALRTLSESNGFWFMLGFSIGVCFLASILTLKLNQLKKRSVKRK